MSSRSISRLLEMAETGDELDRRVKNSELI